MKFGGSCCIVLLFFAVACFLQGCAHDRTLAYYCDKYQRPPDVCYAGLTVTNSWNINVATTMAVETLLWTDIVRNESILDHYSRLNYYVIPEEKLVIVVYNSSKLGYLPLPRGNDSVTNQTSLAQLQRMMSRYESSWRAGPSRDVKIISWYIDDFKGLEAIVNTTNDELVDCYYTFNSSYRVVDYNSYQPRRSDAMEDNGT